MFDWMTRAGGLCKYILKPAAVLAMMASAGPGVAAAPVADLLEVSSSDAFAPTLERLAGALEGAGLTIFARIDHQAAARQAGLAMPPTTVLIYGNPKGGTPLMLAAPALALDLPLRVLVREDADGVIKVALHPAVTLTRGAGLPDDKAAGLTRAEALIFAAVQR